MTGNASAQQVAGGAGASIGAISISQSADCQIDQFDMVGRAVRFLWRFERRQFR